MQQKSVFLRQETLWAALHTTGSRPENPCPSSCCDHVAQLLFGLNQDGIPSMRKNLHVATEPEEARQAALRLRALGLEPPRAHLFKKLAQAESARSSRKEQAGALKGEVEVHPRRCFHASGSSAASGCCWFANVPEPTTQRSLPGLLFVLWLLLYASS